MYLVDIECTEYKCCFHYQVNSSSFQFHLYGTMLPEDLKRGENYQHLPVNEYSLSTPELAALVIDSNVLKHLYPTRVFIYADRYRLFPVSQYMLNNVITESCVLVSGALASPDLGLSVTYAERCPAGPRISIS